MSLADFHTHQRVVIQSPTPRDNGKIDVIVTPDGMAAGMEQWTLARLEQARADGDTVVERKAIR